MGVRSLESGIYVVATPIGNLGDISERAINTLAQADVIAAEDTRHTRRLLDAVGVDTPMISLHEHNEFNRAESLIERVKAGQTIALVSDAGTPLISDPGGILVQKARQRGVRVVTIPGPSAVIAALSISGLAVGRFVFDGFLPSKAKAREEQLEQYMEEPRVVVFYESPHRIVDSLKSFQKVLPERPLVLARELTKTFETVLQGSPAELLDVMAEDANQTKGEFVVLLAGAPEATAEEGVSVEAQGWLRALLPLMPVKKAASVVAERTGAKKNELYQLALSWKEE